MGHNLFISHEESSLPFVEKMAEMFEKNDVICWFAPRDLDQSSAGKEYDDELVEAIREAEAVVVVLNDLALQSIWVKREVSQAEKQGKMIYPFVVSELTINNGLLMRLEDKHLITAYPDPESKFPIILKNVKHLLEHVFSSKAMDELEEKSAYRQVELKNAFDFDYDEGMAFLEVDEERDAFLAFLRSAENGSEKAKEQLFKIMSRSSKDESFLDEKIWEHIEELSDSGKAFADLLMHYKYYWMGTQNDIALKYLKRALNKQVSPYALLQMGICYRWGLGVNTSDVLAMLYFNKAYEAGCDDASSFIGQSYMYGGEKTKKNLQKAEDFLKKGAEKGVARCFSILFQLYCDKKEFGKALDVLQYMIENNIKGGYTLMGNYYDYIAPEKEKDGLKAEDWYKQAIRHNEKDAYGHLALRYWNNFEYDEAYRMAQRGCLESSSLSFSFLGYFYEQDAKDNDYSKAWDCYYQRVLRFGLDAIPLANLYINYSYLPKEYSLEELKQLLIIDAKLQRYESIECLLRIILIEQGKKPVLDYDTFCDMPDTYEYIKMGAELADAEVHNSELMYIYGRLQIEKSGKLHNPYQGVEMITLASKKGNTRATDYAFEHYKGFELKELAKNAICSKTYPIKHLDTILRYAKDESLPEDLKAWISGAMKQIRGHVEQSTTRYHLFQAEIELYKNGDNEDFKTWLSDTKPKLDGGIEKLQMRFLLYREELELCKNGNEIDLELIRKDIDTNRESIAMCGCLSLLKDYIDILYPDYNPSAILDGDYSESKSFFLFYCLRRTPFDSIIVTTIDYETKISNLLLSRGTLRKNVSQEINVKENNNFCHSYTEMLQAYLKLVEAKKSEQIPEDLELEDSQFLLYCPSELVIHYCQLALKMLIASRNAFGEKWQEIVNNLDNHGKLIDIAEMMGGGEDVEDVLIILLDYVDTYIEGESLLKKNSFIRAACKNKDRKLICEELNKCIEELDTQKIEHGLQRFTERDIPNTLFEEEIQNDDFEADWGWPNFSIDL